jgi:hypothetical protein
MKSLASKESDAIGRTVEGSSLKLQEREREAAGNKYKMSRIPDS